MDYPYSKQNAKGKAKDVSPGGTRTEISPRYPPTITDRQKNIHGVSYHPYGEELGSERSQEIC